MTELHYDDFHVGQTFTSRSMEVTRERIIDFAGQWDPQPQHMSEEAARGSNFGELIASGWHTACVTMRLQYEACFSRIANGGMGAGVRELNWLRPVRPGDVLHVEVAVKEMRPSNSRPDRGLVTFLTTTMNGDGQTVETMLGTVIVPRRSEP